MSVPINLPILGKEEEGLVSKVLKSGQLTNASLAGGEMVRAFEGRLKEFMGVKEVVAASSGTAALQIALMVLGIGPGDEVLIPSFTFVATANAVLSVGARPVFVDIDEYYTMDPEDMRKKVSKRAKAIIPVHLYGHTADMERIVELANENSLYVIEDAAQALGSLYHGRMVGGWGHIGCLSFHPSKVITTGEGGALTFKDPELAERARMVRNHGMVKGYDSRIMGLNFRMSEIHAAIGLAQMDRLRTFLGRRRENADFLRERLEDLKGISLPMERDGCSYNWYLFTIASRRRDLLKEKLMSSGIQARVYYETPVHRLPLYAETMTLPRTERACREVLSLPVHPRVEVKDLSLMVELLRENLKT
jgi:dTDP-4-amino-4,6-dideoxygalactose transaminase